MEGLGERWRARRKKILGGDEAGLVSIVGCFGLKEGVDSGVIKMLLPYSVVQFCLKLGRGTDQSTLMERVFLRTTKWKPPSGKRWM